MSPANAAQILADLRRTHAQLKQGRTAPDVKTWSMRLTLEEVDVILAIADERDELRRRLCDDFEGTHTGDPIGREERETPPIAYVHIGGAAGNALCGAPITPHTSTAVTYAYCPKCIIAGSISKPGAAEQRTASPLAEPDESTPYEHAQCIVCEKRIIRRGRSPWLHVTPGVKHPARPHA